MFVADAHCDTLYTYLLSKQENVTPCIRPDALAKGNVGIQTFALFSGVHEDPGTPSERAKSMLSMQDRLGVPVICGSLPDTPPASPHGVLSIEGGEILGGSLDTLEEYAKAGIRMIALTWNYENEIGYPGVSGSTKGLKPFGKELLHRMGELGIIADVSHLNDAGTEDVLTYSLLPVAASHSNVRHLTNISRNLPDELIKGIAKSGGFIGINFCSEFLRQDATAGDCSQEDVLRHMDAFLELGCENCLGLGSDFDGITSWPHDLANPGDFPSLLSHMARHGYPEKTIEKIAGLNLWNLYKNAEQKRIH